MEQEFLMDINLLLIQFEQGIARLHQLGETYGPRLAQPAYTVGEMLPLVLEDEKCHAPKRTATSRDQYRNTRKKWSEEDNQLLINLHERKTDRNIMGEILGRSYNSIRNQLKDLGLIESKAASHES